MDFEAVFTALIIITSAIGITAIIWIPIAMLHYYFHKNDEFSDNDTIEKRLARIEKLLKERK